MAAQEPAVVAFIQHIRAEFTAIESDQRLGGPGGGDAYFFVEMTAKLFAQQRRVLDGVVEVDLVHPAEALPGDEFVEVEGQGRVVEERTIGPQLGQDSIDAGKKAAIAGMIAVVVFMVPKNHCYTSKVISIIPMYRSMIHVVERMKKKPALVTNCPTPRCSLKRHFFNFSFFFFIFFCSV